MVHKIRLYFNQMGKYLKIDYTAKNIDYVLSWESKGISSSDISSIKTNNYLLNPHIDKYDTSKIIIEIIVIYLLMVQRSLNLKQRILKLNHIHYA